MKIIDPDSYAHIRRAMFHRDRAEQQLEDLRLTDLSDVRSLEGSVNSTVNSTANKNTILHELQDGPIRTQNEVCETSRVFDNWKDIPEKAKHLNVGEAGFQFFPKLPQELQLKIWEHAAGDDTDPKVHCIHVGTNGPFLSNQGVPPLTRVSSLSRRVYLAQTGREPAFRTFVNFRNDIIYIRRYERMPHLSAESDDVEDYEGFGPEDYTDHLERFLGCTDAHKIQRLAVTPDFFCQTRYFDLSSTWELHLYMQSRMASWEELMFVFHDERFGSAAWRDRDASFRVLTSREKRRKWVDVKVRYDIRILDGLVREEEVLLALPRVKFRLVCVDRGKCGEARRLSGVTAEEGN